MNPLKPVLSLPPSSEALKSLNDLLGEKTPEFVEFMSRSDGAYCDAETTDVVIFDVASILSAYQANTSEFSALKLMPFGGDGGGEVYVFSTDEKTLGQVFFIPWVDLTPSALLKVADSWASFLEGNILPAEFIKEPSSST